MDPYATLGVPRDAPADVVKRAGKARAQRTHPDHNTGGSVDEFHQVQLAREILEDPVRRKAYDDFGQTEAAPDRRQMVLMAIAQMAVNLAEQVADLEHTDLHARMVESVKTSLVSMRAEREKLEAKIERLERAASRFKRKGEGENMLAQFVRGRINELAGALVKGREQLELGAEILAVLDEYSYQVDVHPGPQAYVNAAYGQVHGLGSIFGGLG